jgi:hypothetical protein
MKILRIERIHPDETYTMTNKETGELIMKAAELELTVRHNLFFTKKLIAIPFNTATVNRITKQMEFIHFVDELGVEYSDKVCKQLTNWCGVNCK